jgi:antitoxin (DNA-binding transcriptional repressor) of toxin-antitoxin stability system
LLQGYTSNEEGFLNAQCECGNLPGGGEEVVTRDRNLPVAKLVPFSAEDAEEQELALVAAGKLRLPKARLDVKKLLKIRTGSVPGNKAIQALLADREEGL